MQTLSMIMAERDYNRIRIEKLEAELRETGQKLTEIGRDACCLQADLERMTAERDDWFRRASHAALKAGSESTKLKMALAEVESLRRALSIELNKRQSSDDLFRLFYGDILK